MRFSTLAAALLVAIPLVSGAANASDKPIPEVYAAWSQVTGSANTTSATGFTDLNLSIRFIIKSDDAATNCPAFTGLVSNGSTDTPVPLRIVKRTNAPSTHALFPVIVCEADAPDMPGRLTLMAGDTAAVLSGSNGMAVSLPMAAGVGADGPPSFVVFGDTGCRGLQNHRGKQDCTEGSKTTSHTRFRFRQVAQKAAALNPDFIVHLGDYRYDTESVHSFSNWDSDFFERVRLGPLTQVPWVFVRGNHEVCSLAGRGWFYMFAPDISSCVGGSRAGDAWHFDVADRSANLADPHRFIVIDTSSYLSTRDINAVKKLSNVITAAQSPGWASGSTPSTWLLMHKPLWAIEDYNGVHQNDQSTGYFFQDVMRDANIPACNTYDAANCAIKAVLAAHLHVLQNVVTVGEALPQQYIVGNSGVRMDRLARPSGCQFDMNPWGMGAGYQTAVLADGRGRTDSFGNGTFGFAHFTRDPADGQSGWKGDAYYLDTANALPLTSSKNVKAPSGTACQP